MTPEAYYLFDAVAVGVPELCDAFKVRYVVSLNVLQSVSHSCLGICTNRRILRWQAERRLTEQVCVHLPDREALLQAMRLSAKWDERQTLTMVHRRHSYPRPRQASLRLLPKTTHTVSKHRHIVHHSLRPCLPV